MTIDAHAHVSDSDYGNVELLINRLDEAGIEQCIIVPGGMLDVRVMTLYLTGDKKPEAFIPNQVVYQALRRYPDRLKGYVCINPLKEDEAYRLFSEGIKEGCVGVKLNPLGHKFAFSGRVLDTLADECGKRQLPVYTHTLFDPGARSTKLGAWAQKHKNTNFILGHMGFGSVDVQAIELAAKLPNFYLETSLCTWMCLHEALKICGPDKIIFGSEFPMSTPKIQLFQINELPLKREDKEKILFRNIMKLVPAYGKV